MLQLEQRLGYYPRQLAFNTEISCLEKSVCVFYTGDPHSIVPLSGSLKISDFPSLRLQLHIHEGKGGTAHLKTYNGEKIGISSYDAAMADFLAGKIDVHQYLKRARER